MGDDGDALPQRPNARRRMRAQHPADQPPSISETGTCAPSSSARDTKPQEERGAAAPRAPTDDNGAPLTSPACAAGNDSGKDSCGAGGTPPRGESDGATTAPEEGGPGEGARTGSRGGDGDAGVRGDSGGSGDDDLPAYRSAAVGAYKFEYLDHTADVQLHGWGRDLTEAFENVGLAMFNYMSPLQHVQPREGRSYRAEGHDLPSLLYGFLDELLFVFSTELFLAASLTITSFDRVNWVIEAEGRGETFDRGVHEVGTEIKAITYSAMAITERPGDAEVFVIVDI